MTRFSNFFLLILAGISFLFMSSVYVVDEREKALRLWFGEAVSLYTSDAADDLHCVDLGGRRIIKKKNNLLY